MKVVMVMFDSLNRHMLEPYGCKETITPNFMRLAEKAIQFDCCYAASLPCMPARRELHTGRYNFLHRSWGPMEPFDESMPAILKNNGIHSHLISDHSHYWEDGGATYHNRYSTWEGFRGQEGDPWMAVVGGVEDTDPNLIRFDGYRGSLYRQDVVNRTFMADIQNHPQTRTFQAGLDFLERNAEKDNWFLQIECFDPHEPFFTYDKYKNMYKTDYKGRRFDWPDYAAVQETPEEVQEGRRQYKALLTMCDESLGKILDSMDAKDMWKDTMLIVNTDHGYMLGEHGFWAKSYMPLYEEISHIPLYIWNPRDGRKGVKSSALVQTVDIPATILSFFNLEKPKNMLGMDIFDRSCERESRRAVLFGIHGTHLCCTDGRFVYMRAPRENTPLFEYTLMPTHMVGFFSNDALKTMEKCDGFRFTDGVPVMKIRADGKTAASFGDLLYDLESDPHQNTPIENAAVAEKMCAAMRELLALNDAPSELYIRFEL